MLLSSFFGKGCGPSFDNLVLPSGCFVPNFIEIEPVVLEKRIFNVKCCCYVFLYNLPLVKHAALHLKDTWIPFLGKICSGVLKRMIFNDASVFSLVHYHLLYEKCLALHLNKFDSLHPVMLCVTFDSNLASGSGDKKIVRSYPCIFTMLLLSPSEKGIILFSKLNLRSAKFSTH